MLAKRMSALALGHGDHQLLNTLEVNSERLERLTADFAVLLKDGTFKVHTFQQTKDMTSIPGLTGNA